MEKIHTQLSLKLSHYGVTMKAMEIFGFWSIIPAFLLILLISLPSFFILAIFAAPIFIGFCFIEIPLAIFAGFIYAQLVIRFKKHAWVTGTEGELFSFFVGVILGLILGSIVDYWITQRINIPFSIFFIFYNASALGVCAFRTHGEIIRSSLEIKNV